MNTKDSRDTLEKIPADYNLVTRLYAKRKINTQARNYALNLLYPEKQWGLWTSRLFLVLGITLILSGIIYFFAFNWAKLSIFIKFSLIQLSILLCLAGSYGLGLNRTTGQLLLFCASVLLGVLLAVFGQIYQTGAQLHSFLFVWGLLIMGWTLISNFAPQWILWLTLINASLISAWTNDLFLIYLPDNITRYKLDYIFFNFLAITNTAILILHEHLIRYEKYIWLKHRWIRILFVTFLMFTTSIPVIDFILNEKYPVYLITSIIIHIITLACLYLYYRYKQPDIWSLTIISCSICTIIWIMSGQIGHQIIQTRNEEFLLLALGTEAIILSAFAINHLIRIKNKIATT